MEDKKQEQQQQQNNQAPQQQRNCTIFIGDLDETFEESYITVVFHRYGPIKSVILRKDPFTNQPKGYCFIEYANEEAAQKAIKEANGMKIGRKNVRVVQFKNPRELNPEANIFISKIDKDLDQNALNEYFGQYGKIVSIRITTDSQGNSLGYGYLQFDSTETADKVIAQTHHTVQDKPVEVCKFIAKKNREVNTERKVIYVSNISLQENQNKEQLEEQARKIFEKYGVVENISLSKDETKNRYYAFISFQTEQQATAAISSTNNTDAFQNGINVLVSLPLNKETSESDQNESNLFSKNIKLNVTEEQLYAAYESYGKLTQIKLARQTANPNIRTDRQPLQYAFLYFENKEAAQKALFNAYSNAKVQELYEHKNVQLTLLLSKESKQEYNKQTKKPLQLSSNPFINKSLKPMPPMVPPFPFNAPMMGAGFKQQRQGAVQQYYGGKQQYNKHNNNNYNKKPRNYNNQYQNNNNRKPYQNRQNYNNNNNQQQPQQQRQQQQQQLQINQQMTAQLEAKIALGDKEKQEVWKWLGTQIYPRVREQIGDQKASKVTGMLVDLDTYTINDIVDTINRPDQLKSLVTEAVELLQQSEQ